MASFQVSYFRGYEVFIASLSFALAAWRRRIITSLIRLNSS